MMRYRLVSVLGLLVATSAVATACGGDDDGGASGGTSSGHGGTSSGGASNTGGAARGGATSGGASSGGTSSAGGAIARGGSGGASSAGASNGGAANGGMSGGPGAGMGGEGPMTGGTAGEGPLGGAGGVGGVGGVGGASAEGGAGGAAHQYPPGMVARGAYLVHSVALCGGCHTATNGAELAGNAAFKGGALPAPNLTPDATGLGDWSDAQIITAFRDGIDDEGRHLDPAMPYWLFHNMSDDDAQSIVAFLRSLTPAAGEIGAGNPNATAVTPLSPAAFPDTTLASTDANYAAAQQGKYLLSGVAQCVKCHSPASGGLPAQSYFSGVAPTSTTQIFSPNITQDATGIAGWTAADIATALKLGTDKANKALCGSMPSAAKGYGGLSDADATAIGVYISTIPSVANAAAAPSLEPACP